MEMIEFIIYFSLLIASIILELYFLINTVYNFRAFCRYQDIEKREKFFRSAKGAALSMVAIIYILIRIVFDFLLQ